MTGCALDGHGLGLHCSLLDMTPLDKVLLSTNDKISAAKDSCQRQQTLIIDCLVVYSFPDRHLANGSYASSRGPFEGGLFLRSICITKLWFERLLSTKEVAHTHT
jgi:hypothetical protein